MNFEMIMDFFEENKNENNISGMSKFGISTDKIYGIKMDSLRKLSKEIGNDHELALQLWEHGYHESRILATLIDEADRVDEDQLDEWVNDFDTWDICDQACINLFSNIPLAISKIPIWATSKKEFVKRTAFSLIAVIAVHDKKSDNSYFENFLLFKMSFHQSSDIAACVSSIGIPSEQETHIGQNFIGKWTAHTSKSVSGKTTSSPYLVT